MSPSDAPLSDRLIADDIIRALADQADIEAGEILIEVRDGQVTLTGDVPEQAMKQRAERLVSTLPGVAGVRNLLNVDDGSASFGPPGEAVRGLDPDESPGPTEAPRGRDAGTSGKDAS